MNAAYRYFLLVLTLHEDIIRIKQGETINLFTTKRKEAQYFDHEKVKGSKIDVRLLLDYDRNEIGLCAGKVWINTYDPDKLIHDRMQNGIYMCCIHNYRLLLQQVLYFKGRILRESMAVVIVLEYTSISGHQKYFTPALYQVAIFRTFKIFGVDRLKVQKKNGKKKSKYSSYITGQEF
ncbi:hypothetical protein F4703DRAFT_1791913 [Phycomyces blakesleeanus]